MLMYLKFQLKREIKNFLRERNAAVVKVFFDLIKGFKSKSPTDRLRSISLLLSNFPSVSRFDFFISQGKSLSRGIYSNPVFNDYKQSLLTNSLIIKPFVSKEERGVILVSFESQLKKIISSEHFDSIESRYIIVFIPSWTGFFSPELIALSAISSRAFYVMPVHADERKLCSNLSDLCFPLPFNAASWVNESFYALGSEEKVYDCLMVANFSGFKRHWLLFKAMKGMPEHINALCAGVARGSRTASEIIKEAEFYGVEHRVTVVENPKQADLRKYFKQSKVFCAMTFKEGSFISVAESLVSGTPVVMFENAKIGTKELIDGSNGRLATSVSDFSNHVIDLLRCADNKSIQRKAVEEFSASANNIKLNEILQRHADSRGEFWTRATEPFYSMRLQFFYLNNLPNDIKEDVFWFEKIGLPIKISKDLP